MMRVLGPAESTVSDIEDKLKKQKEAMEETIKGKMRQCEGYLMAIEDFAKFMDAAFLGFRSVAMANDGKSVAPAKDEFVPIKDFLKEAAKKKKK